MIFVVAVIAISTSDVGSNSSARGFEGSPSTNDTRQRAPFATFTATPGRPRILMLPGTFTFGVSSRSSRVPAAFCASTVAP